jgi:hypothetical protein
MKEFEWSHLVMIAPSIPLIRKHFVSSGSIRFYILAWVIGNAALSRGIQIRLSRWGISAQYVFGYAFERHLCTHGHLGRCFMPGSTGSTCNTPGVDHQLSSGFKLKHDRLSGDDNVKVNLWRWAWPKVGCCTIALHIGPFSKIYAWMVLLQYLHVSYLGTYLCGSLEKFHEVWNQKVTWNDKLYPGWNGFTKCLNCTIKWVEL